MSTLATIGFALGYPISILVIARWIPVVRERRWRWFWVHQIAVAMIVMGWIIEGETRSVAVNSIWLVTAAVWFMRGWLPRRYRR